MLPHFLLIVNIKLNAINEPIPIKISFNIFSLSLTRNHF